MGLLCVSTGVCGVRIGGEGEPIGCRGSEEEPCFWFVECMCRGWESLFSRSFNSDRTAPVVFENFVALRMLASKETE